MRFKKILLSVCCATMLVPATSVFASEDTSKKTTLQQEAKAKVDEESANNVKLILDGNELETPVPPRIVDNYTFVPLRVITDEFGAEIKWNNETKSAKIEMNGKKITLFVGKKNVYIDAFEQQMEVAPIIADGTTLVPLRFVGEQLGIEFMYDNETKTVYMISAKQVEVPDDPSNPTNNDNTTNNGDKSEDDQVKSSTISGIVINESGIIVQSDASKLAPKIFTLANPYRLVIDIDNAVLDSKLAEAAKASEGKMVSTHPLIEQIRYSQFSQNPNTVRITLELKSGAKHFVVPQTTPGQFAIEITTYSIPSHKIVVIDGVKKYNVVLDAGHGGTDPGASSVTKRNEKDFTLPMIQKVGAILEKEKHLNVLYTRDDDTFVELDDRVTFTNDNNAAVFVSIHGNKFTKSSVNGIETYYYHDDSIGLASIVHENVLKASGLADREVRKSGFRVIKGTTMPAILLEAGYLSNPGDEAMMYDEAFQNKLAEAIASSIIEFTGVKEGIK